jgi:non-specific serine/threonine protein kinase
LEQEHDNIRAALEWGMAQPEQEDIEAAIRLSGALWRFWMIHSHFTEGRKWLERGLEYASRSSPNAQEPPPPVPTELRATLYYGAGIMALGQGDVPAATAYYEQALALYSELRDKQGISWVLNDLGVVASFEDNLQREAELYEESLALKRELGVKRDIAIALGNLSEVARALDDHERAAALAGESLVLAREAGDRYQIVAALNGLGYAMHHLGDHERGADLMREALVVNREMGNKVRMVGCVVALAGMAATRGQARRAAQLFGAMESVLEALNAVYERCDRIDYDRNVAAARALLDGTAFAEAWAKGRAMSLEEAIELALQPLPEPQPEPEPQSGTPQPVKGYPNELTEREVDVLRLVAEGLSNPRIAEQLYLSTFTVQAHLRSIYSKLGVTSRAEAARFAAEHGLVKSNA